MDRVYQRKPDWPTTSWRSARNAVC